MHSNKLYLFRPFWQNSNGISSKQILRSNSSNSLCYNIKPISRLNRVNSASTRDADEQPTALQYVNENRKSSELLNPDSNRADTKYDNEKNINDNHELFSSAEAFSKKSFNWNTNQSKSVNWFYNQSAIDTAATKVSFIH